MAWVIVVLCFLCLVAGVIALVFLQDGEEERAEADREHHAEARRAQVADLSARRRVQLDLSARMGTHQGKDAS